MPYTPVHADWKDYPDTTTPVTAAALEQIERGIVEAYALGEAAIDSRIVNAKGDLIVGTAADTVARKAVGAGDTVLVAASGEVDGLVWQKIARAQLQTVTRKGVPLATLTSALTNNAWPDAATNYVELLIPVPDDYVSGDITFKIFRRAGGTGGTAVMRKSSFRFRDGVAIATIDSAVNIDLTPANTLSNVLTATIAAANFQAGDVLRMQISRVGADAGDTLASAVQFDGAWIEYTGYA